MNRRNTLFHDISIRAVKLINIILMTVPFGVAWYSAYADMIWVKFYMRGHWMVIGLAALLYILIGRIYEAFKISYNNIGEMIYSQMLSLFEVDCIMYVVSWLLIRRPPAVLPMLLVFASQTVLSVLWTLLSRWWYFRTFPANKTIIIWDARKGISQLIDRYNLERKFKIVATASVDECIDDLTRLDDADTVFLVDVHSHDRNIITKYCLKNGITAYLIPRVGDLILSSAKTSNIMHLLMLKVERFNPTFEYLIVKRLGDVLLSLAALIILSPVMLVTAVAIKLEDHGQVIYKQRRLTKNGREFEIYKFRSMSENAEQDGIARLSAGDDDDRVTRVGRVIRKVRIDELPQLVNIIKGDLSIVGPRPERPDIAEQYMKELPEFELRLQVKAGLTGYAQVYGKYNSTPYDKLLMDLMYIANANVFEDIRIIFATVKILFMEESTEGVTREQIEV